MKSFIFVLACFLSLNVYSQPSWSWVNSYGEVSYHEYTTAMCTDANGTSYVTGTFEDTIIFGNDTLLGGGMFLTKFDSSGNTIWAIKNGGQNVLEINSMCLDDSGNVYLAGGLSGTIFFGNDTITYTGHTRNIFLGKFDSTGNFLWAQQSASNEQNTAYGVAVNHNSEVYITGVYDSSMTIGNTFLQGGNIFVAKYDGNGNNLWALTCTGSTVAQVTGIACDNFDHVCITGYFHNTISFGNITLTTPFNVGSATLIFKFDSSGNALWGKQSGGFPSSAHSRCVSSDPFGNFYCAGYFDSPIMIFENDTLVNAGNNDLFLVKYDSIGDLTWAKRAGGPDYDDANAIISDKFGNIYMTGYFKTFISFGSTFLNGPNQELYVSKYDANGNPLWAASATGGLNEVGSGIGIDSSNNVYVGGSFTSPTSTFGTHVITNKDPFTGSYDIFFAKLNENPTGVFELGNSAKESLMVYPNPCRGSFRIVNDFVGKATLRIYDLQGRILDEMTLNNDKMVELKNISLGTYLLELTSKKEIRICKLVMQR